MGRVPDIAAAHFAAIMDKAREARELLDVALESDLGDDITPQVVADEAVDELIDLILHSPDTPKVMLALAAPAGAA